MQLKVVREKDDILSFPINVDAVLQHLHRDMRDDWFEDALQHKDLFQNKVSLREVLHELLAEGHGRYIASLRSVYDIPKKGFGVRYSLETDFYDRFIYQAICSFLMPFYDPLLSPRVLGHRYNKRRKDEKNFFKPRIELWNTFEGVTYTALQNNQALFATDLINYFENITVENIRNAFESLLAWVSASGPEKVLIRNAINTLCELLHRWGFSEKHGLPQNRDASSFVANVLLNTVDQAMVSLGFDYYRYVDDIRIICDNKNAARRAAGVLIGQLRSAGMNINNGKTKILTAESSAEDVAEFFPVSDDRSAAVDSMWRSRSRRVIVRSVKYIFEILRECVVENKTQSRQFRFAVNRLIVLIEAEIFDVKDPIAEDLKDILIGSLEEHAVSTDQYCRLLLRLDLNPSDLKKLFEFLSDHEKAIHSWQNYQLWMVLARSKYKTPELLELALERLKNGLHRAEVAAIFVYLRCVGEEKNLEGLVAHFDSDWSYYHQRNFLLATSNFSPEIMKPLVKALRARVKGTAIRAKSHYVDGLPIAERDKTPLLKIYDEINPYD